MTKRKTTKKAGVRVTGRSVAYIQSVGKKGKLGKAQPVVLTTVAVKPTEAVTSKRRKKK